MASPKKKVGKLKERTLRRFFFVLGASAPCDAWRYADIIVYALSSRFLAQPMCAWLRENGCWPSEEVSFERDGKGAAELAFGSFWGRLSAACDQAHHHTLEVFRDDRVAFYVLDRSSKANVAFAARNAAGTATREEAGVLVKAVDTWAFSGCLDVAEGEFHYVLEDALLNPAQWAATFGTVAPLIMRSCVDAVMPSPVIHMAPGELLAALGTASEAPGGRLGVAVGFREAVSALRSHLQEHFTTSTLMKKLVQSAASDPVAQLPSYVAELVAHSREGDWPEPSHRQAALHRLRRLQPGGIAQSAELVSCVCDLANAGLRFRLPLAAFDSLDALQRAIDAQWAPKLADEALATTTLTMIDAALAATGSALAPSSATTVQTSNTAPAARNRPSSPSFNTTITGTRPAVAGPLAVLGTRFRVTFFKANTRCAVLETRAGVVLVNGGSGPAFARVVWPTLRAAHAAGRLVLCVATHCNARYIGGLLLLYRHFAAAHRQEQAGQPQPHGIPPLLAAQCSPRESAPPDAGLVDLALAAELSSVAARLGALRRVTERDTTVELAGISLRVRCVMANEAPAAEAAAAAAASREQMPPMNPVGLAVEAYHRGTNSRVLLTGNVDAASAAAWRSESVGILPGDARSLSLVEIPRGAGPVISSTQCAVWAWAPGELEPAVVQEYLKQAHSGGVPLYVLEKSPAFPPLPPERCLGACEDALVLTFHGSGVCEASFLPERAPSPIASLEKQRSGLVLKERSHGSSPTIHRARADAARVQDASVTVKR